MNTVFPRTRVLEIIQTAMAVGEFNFARQTALAWLANYPGDLSVALFHAEILVREAQQAAQQGPSSQTLRMYDRSIAVLRSLCQVDPEFLPAQELLAHCLFMTRFAPRSGVKPHVSEWISQSFASQDAVDRQAVTLRRADFDTFGDVLALGGTLPTGSSVPEWSVPLRRAYRCLSRLRNAKQSDGEGESASESGQRMVHEVLLGNPSTPLAAVTHLTLETYRELPLPAIRSLAELYHERWPGCVQFILLLADACMENGEGERAVALLHQAVAADVTGQVARRLWGYHHPYSTLWPDQLDAPVLKDLPIPAGVAAAMGWNQLSAGSLSDQEDTGSEVDRAPIENRESYSIGSSVSIGSGLPTNTPRHECRGTVIPTDTAAKTHTNEADFSGFDPSIQSELERLAGRLKQPQLGRLDGRFPIYVILTTRRGLQEQYGLDNTALIEEGMLRLAEAVRQRQGWGAMVFYADEGLAAPGGGPLTRLRQKPARYNDPWSLKLALADLDAALGEKGEMIGALLIIGGPEVVPFHHLPNPVDDADADVPSDNPYATRDENYFIPEWPVGRLPGGTGSSPALLLGALVEITHWHSSQIGRRDWLRNLVGWWEELRSFTNGRRRSRMRLSLGYTAAVWKHASQAVFRPAAGRRSLLVSPPVQAGDLSVKGPAAAKKNGSQRLKLYSARLGYFNLHGLPDAAEWFGQRDPSSSSAGPDYPVALRPEDLAHPCPAGCVKEEGSTEHGSLAAGGQNRVLVVFTEACYGAHILGKRVDEALSLRFLAAGSQAVVGSTCIAYGAIGDPLTAADLLGCAFWNYLDRGLPAGEALRRAKIHLAREMHRRQGYLDGEDQKTLISFVLYGDPLAQPLRARRGPKTILRPMHPPTQVKTVCDRASASETTETIRPEVLNYVKSIVAQYLPGMAGAQMSISQEHAACGGVDHQCPTSQIGVKSGSSQQLYRQVVVLQKSVSNGVAGSGHTHRHYARLTLDKRGKLVKLVVSR